MRAAQRLQTAVTAVVLLRLLANGLCRWRSAEGDHVGRDGQTTPVGDEVTVVIVALNEERQIRDTLQRVATTSPDASIIVYDDGSTDRTVEYCAALAGKYSAITLISGEHQGKMSGLRAALDAVTTPLVLTLDADTLVDEGAIEVLAYRVASSDLSACAGNMRPSANPSFTTSMQEAEFALLNADRRFLDWYGCVSILPGAFTMWRTEALRHLVMRARNDIDLTFDALRSGLKTGYCDAAACSTSVPDRYSQVLRQRRRWARRKLLRSPQALRTVGSRTAPKRARLAQGHILFVHVLIGLLGWLADLQGLRAAWRCLRSPRQRDVVEVCVYIAVLLAGARAGGRISVADQSPILQSLLRGPWERSTRALAAWSVIAWPRRNDEGWQPHRPGAVPGGTVPN